MTKHNVFQEWIVTYKDRSTDPSKVVTVQVDLDLDRLANLAVKATKNKSGKAHDGALHVKLLSVREVTL